LIRLAIIGLALVAALPARAADLRVTIVEHGLYTADIKSEQRAQDGIIDTVIENLCHYATTTTVPLKTGVHFGFRYRVDGLTPGEVVALGKIIEFPKTVTPPGARPISRIWRPLPTEAGKLSYAGYGLDYDWELMPGRWAFYIHQADRKLAEISFAVVEGADAPAPSARDSTCFKLSSL
jgi:hypothetical protein